MGNILKQICSNAYVHIIYIYIYVYIYTYTRCPIVNDALRFLENYGKYEKRKTKIVWFKGI